MRNWLAVMVLGWASLAAQEAPIPRVDEMGGRPFAIKNTWVIGGTGDWDYLALDPVARQLFIAHGPRVQVVDVESGTVVGTIDGFHQAHAVVLDERGQYGYATDGFPNALQGRVPSAQGNPKEFTYAGGVQMFDRRSLRIVANILTSASLRAITLDPETGLLFALGTDTSTLPAPPEPTSLRWTNRRTAPAQASAPVQPSPCSLSPFISSRRIPESVIAVIDPEKRAEIAEIRVCGLLGSATADGTGGVYVTFATMNMAARLDAPALLHLLPDRDRIKPNAIDFKGRQYTYNRVPQLDWRARTKVGAANDEALPQLRVFPFSECKEPHGVAVDGRRNHLFVGCNNQKLAVLDSVSGASIASFTVGPGTDSIAYDPGRGLIYSANGGGYGSVTVVRQHATDSYAVIQNLPTLQRARTMAIDPSTGMLYVVTTLYGAKLSNPPANGIGTLKLDPINGSFQVLVIGN